MDPHRAGELTVFYCVFFYSLITISHVTTDLLHIWRGVLFLAHTTTTTLLLRPAQARSLAPSAAAHTEL